ncbi:MAG: accessory Sec system translocase SecA2 [Ruminiclostridium sp.]|nr:accessory Sec system translocase SecA2 [Ruminiclostridium sp.]
MRKNKSLINSLKNIRSYSTELDLEPCCRLLEEINKIKTANLDNYTLKRLSLELKKKAQNGIPLEDILVDAFALGREASERVLGMRHFDVQVIAGIAMHYNALVEMQTGEGKTLAAVLPAYLNALTEKGVHILTFNDYLAQRDAGWMGPVYEFLGLSVGYVREGMDAGERKKAYSCDITYLTAKEAGFDYLRSFLCTNVADLVLRPFNCSIIDEADSILIDEARIPLVIAGKTEGVRGIDPLRMAEVIKGLKPELDYSFDEYERNVFLTEKGTTLIEDLFKCGNLYSEGNLSLLVDVNNALHANLLLKKDVDYIVRKGKVELVDEFTGRVADKRQWPHGLQEAIEAKEGIISSTKGQILFSITLQSFIGLYPKICGMTGTVHPAEEEFLEFYGLNTAVIPTNKECIRIDHPDVIFTHNEAKLDALAEEISTVHKTGRPILIGTGSVEESECLAAVLEGKGICCNVLNARNDAQEAAIVANAGAPGAVTVSTNMAGRGTDIKLGGQHEEEYGKVVELGGLYVIGTNRHESRRIDNQLRGRAGRQGDPGSTRFFISLEDDLMKQYKLKELIPAALYPAKQAQPLDNNVIRREIGRAQRIVEGQNFDIRRTMRKYSVLMERQRQMIYKWRFDTLSGVNGTTLMKERIAARYDELLPVVGEKALDKAERQVTLHYINSCWADYLDFLSYTRETIHLVNIAGKIPISEFNKISIDAFEKLLEEIKEEAVNTLASAEITSSGIDMDKAGLKAPSSTWTYLVDDNPEQLGIIKFALGYDPFSVVLMTISMALQAIHKAASGKRRLLK